MKSYIYFLSRNKLYTAIEAVGLTVSLAFVILIGTYVCQQYGIAYENPDHDRIYAVYAEEQQMWTGYMDKTLIDGSVPEAEVSARFSGGVKTTVTAGGENYLVVQSYLDKEFFDIFPYYSIIEGSADVLDDPSNVIVSSTFANTVSPDGSSVVGMRLRLPDNPDKDYTIAAVMEDFEKTLFPYSDVIFNIRETGLEQYGYNTVGSVATFFRVPEGTDREALLEKMKPLYDSNYKWVSPVLYRLDEVYFLPVNYLLNCTSATMLRLLLVVVLALLISAVFNYINLTFALTGKRAKEMATRRLIGAGKPDIFIKNILESVAFTLCCFALAILLAVSLVPMINSLLVGSGDEVYQVPLAIDLNAGYLAVCLAAAVLLGVTVGLMPALNALRFKPIDVIKGSFRRQDKMVFTKVFIVIQNALSLVLIAIAVLMEVQLSHMINRPMNANMDNLYFMMVGSSATEGQPLLDRLERLSEVKSVGIGTGYPGGMNMGFAVRMEDEQPHVMVQTVICDSTYFRLIAPEVVRDFNYPLTGSVWLGESTAAALGLDEGNLGQIPWKFYVNGAEPTHVGGVFRDIPTKSAIETDVNENSAFVVERLENIEYNFSVLIHTTSESKEVEDKILAEYYAFAREKGILDPPYISTFLSDSIRESIAPAIRTIRLVELFMILAVLLSLLGLVAMSTYFSEQKSKEIAVRKVFGGTVRSETFNNVRSYMIMVVTACIIGIPIAVYAAGRYLQQFPYRIENYWWVFALAVLISFAVSLLSVLWQTLKAARTNPARELKKE